MIIIEPCDTSCGDYTQPYKVILDKKYIVKDFVEAVSSRTYEGFWGSISFNGVKICEYKDGKILSVTEEYAKILDKAVILVKGHGGYSLLNFYIQDRSEEDYVLNNDICRSCRSKILSTGKCSNFNCTYIKPVL